MLLAAATSATAAPANEYNVFAFTGRMLDENMGDSLRLFSADYEDNYITGVGAQDFVLRTGIVSIGYELGGAARYGLNSTFEAWGGLVGRIDDIPLLGLYLSPSLAFGLSYVSGVQEGREQQLADETGCDARVLFYLSPELDVRTSPEARYSVFYRLQHRSGAWNTLCMQGASNANVVGLRVRF
jgi:hypothetical protein